MRRVFTAVEYRIQETEYSLEESGQDMGMPSWKE
jgi:hypothetical protein